ncbi:MAG TPA: ATP-dependent Clp protease ATP-binding subunit [Magnetospirillaceae bacterium]|nr:ATP-dependent Clp protease ATP-binding subunit [Magnetospirillaceae bacterium]
MAVQLNLRSQRAGEARLALVFGKKGSRLLFGLTGLVLLLVAAWFWWLQSSTAWFIAGLAAWPFMLLAYSAWWLADVPPRAGSADLDAVMEAPLLGRLKPNMTPRQLAEAVMHTNGGLFFALRLGIGPNFLRELSGDNPADTTAIWELATKTRQSLGFATLSSAVLTASLVRSMPNHQQLLARLQLTDADLDAGVRWYHHLQDLVAAAKHQKIGGGLGRDLSFGYTPTLQQFAVNVSNQVGAGTLARQVESHTRLLTQLMQQLSQGGRQNAVLVGQNGVGKTTVVYSFAEQLLRADASVPPSLHYRQVMMLDPASLISHARQRGELEGLLNQILLEAYHAKNIILFLDNAELFFTDGTGSVDVRNILLPALEAGGLRMVLSMDEQQWLRLSRDTPSLAQQLNRIAIPPLNETETLLACEDQLLAYEFDHKVSYMYQALKVAYRLGARYVIDQAMPGQALSVLQAAAQHADRGLVTAASVEKAVEQSAGVKVGTANKGEERDTLLHLEDLIHKRMINQTYAVNAVANALRRARSGVRNQKRPIGSFMFLGPTGVGKTELAKALADVYFGGEDHIVRLDLNEFGQASDVTRLIADGASDPRSLTAQIAKQPFSVVLLDEIEKAHPNVLDTLLQLLDEGILRDTNNREISFRDAIIIATSNAGADRIRQYIVAGYQLEQFEEKFVSELIDTGQFKPEFLNRFDEITVFRPLTADELLQVVDLMLAGINKTLAEQQLAVVVADDAKRLLVQKGSDPRLGARPLRRMVQRTVENIVAKQVLSEEVGAGQTVRITVNDIERSLEK